MTSWFEWSGAFLGLAGAALLSLNNRISGWGFVLFLLSNFAWIFFAWFTQAWGLLLMQIGFMLTSINGIRNYFARAAVTAGQ